MIVELTIKPLSNERITYSDITMDEQVFSTEGEYTSDTKRTMLRHSLKNSKLC